MLVAKLRRLAPITAISTEHVKFDTPLMENPDVSGVEYQAGTWYGYEIKEFGFYNMVVRFLLPMQVELEPDARKHS